jgi:hypothetical protein
VLVCREELVERIEGGELINFALVTALPFLRHANAG